MEPQASSTELQRQTLPVLQEAAVDATLEEAASAAGKALKQLLSALAVMFLIAVCATARYSWAVASKARQLLGEGSVQEEIIDLEQPAEKCQQGEQPGEESKSKEPPGEMPKEAWQETQKQEEQFTEQPAEKESEYSAPQQLAPENSLVRYWRQLELREMEIVQQERQLYAQAQDIMQRVQEVQQEKESIERQQQTGPRTNLPRQSALSSGPGPEVAATPTPGRSRRVPQRTRGKHSPADSELSIGRSEGSVGSSSAPRWRF